MKRLKNQKQDPDFMKSQVGLTVEQQYSNSFTYISTTYGAVFEDKHLEKKRTSHHLRNEMSNLTLSGTPRMAVISASTCGFTKVGSSKM